MAFHPFTTTHSELEVNCQPYIVENSKKEEIQLNQYNGILHSLNTVLEKEENVETLKKRSLQIRLTEELVYRVTFIHRNINDANMYNGIIGSVLVLTIFNPKKKMSDKQLENILLPGNNLTLLKIIFSYSSCRRFFNTSI